MTVDEHDDGAVARVVVGAMITTALAILLLIPIFASIERRP